MRNRTAKRRLYELSTTPQLVAPRNPIAQALNKPMAVAIIAAVVGYGASFAKDAVLVTGRVATLEEWSADHKRNSITRDEFNRLDREVQTRATREEVAALNKRLDDLRSDISEIKRAVVDGKR